MAQVSEWASRMGLDPVRVSRLELAVEEAAENICRYAYPEGEGEFHLETIAEAGLLVIQLSDEGKPFDPLDVPPPDEGASLDDRPIGGLGIHLVRRLMDDVGYRREGDRNVLLLEMRLKT